MYCLLTQIGFYSIYLIYFPISGSLCEKNARWNRSRFNSWRMLWWMSKLNIHRLDFAGFCWEDWGQTGVMKLPIFRGGIKLENTYGLVGQWTPHSLLSWLCKGWSHWSPLRGSMLVFGGFLYEISYEAEYRKIWRRMTLGIRWSWCFLFVLGSLNLVK